MPQAFSRVSILLPLRRPGPPNRPLSFAPSPVAPAQHLTNPSGVRMIPSTSLLFGADLGFHAEWLRDEPCDATATGSRSSIATARCQLSTRRTGNMRFGVREFKHFQSLFFRYPGKEDFVCRADFNGARSESSAGLDGKRFRTRSFNRQRWPSLRRDVPNRSPGRSERACHAIRTALS